MRPFFVLLVSLFLWPALLGGLSMHAYAKETAKPAPAAAPPRKLAPAELCEYQVVLLRDREAQLNLQIAELQQALITARAELQRAGRLAGFGPFRTQSQPRQTPV